MISPTVGENFNQPRHMGRADAAARLAQRGVTCDAEANAAADLCASIGGGTIAPLTAEIYLPREAC